MTEGLTSDLRQLVRDLRRQGFSVDRTRGGHLMVRCPDGRAVCTLSGTPGDRRAHRNARAQLRRAGARLRPGR